MDKIGPDPEARLTRKSQKYCRQSLLLCSCAERRVTLGGDKGYDDRRFVAECRKRHVTPHVAQNLKARGGSAIDARTAGRAGYAVSQRIRKRVEEIFGWSKTVGNFRKTRFVGLSKNRLAGFMLGAAYDLVRLSKLLPLPEPA